MSMGGNGTWYLAYRNPNKFAAIAPICAWVVPFNPWFRAVDNVIPNNTSSPFESLAQQLSEIPIWIFHGEEDNTVPVDQSRQAAAALTKVNKRVHYTEFLGISHNSWDAAYGSTQFVTWLFSQQRKP
jgi:predicted peptidase